MEVAIGWHILKIMMFYFWTAATTWTILFDKVGYGRAVTVEFGCECYMPLDRRIASRTSNKRVLTILRESGEWSRCCAVCRIYLVNTHVYQYQS